jgi:GTP-binding protein
MTNGFDASFMTGARSVTQFPPDVGREVAIAGRSNSGKSSSINAITGRSRLARTSKTPGRTREINFFGVGDERRIVDLPGYGYAKVSVEMREKWRAVLERYFRARHSLRGLIVTVDIRRGIGELDAVMLGWAESAGVPAAVLATKADKLSRSAAQTAQRQMAEAAGPTIAVILFSSTSRLGVDDARAQLRAWLDSD